jgi:hypothetical protein
VILFHHREYRGRGKGVEQTGKICQIEVKENSFFLIVVESLDVASEHAHI